MEKNTNGKKIVVIAVLVIALLAIVGFVIYQKNSSSNSYRSIQIYNLKGSATITREGVGELAAAENLMLQSGDTVKIEDESSLRLKMDDDKYALVEENSVFTVVADGTKENAKTSIELKQGAITSEIKNKLNSKSSYEVTTPNSVMAVRGTVFRVEVKTDEKGNYYVILDTFEGKVGVKLINPDGTIEDDEKMVKGGKEVTIYSDEEISKYMGGLKDIDYSKLPLEVLEFLLEIIEEDGRELKGITAKDLKKLVEEKKQEPDYYEITFQYNGTAFATQQVEPGKNVSKPKLAPNSSGSWNFDFSKEIHENTTIEWK